MDEVQTVTVYAFHLPGEDAEVFEHAPFKATRDVIVQTYGGRVLEGTAEDVEIEALDAQGRYRRIATGWGALH